MFWFLAFSRGRLQPALPGHLLHRITTLAFTIASVAVSSLLDTPALAEKSARRPNIVVILTDDQGWGDLSLHGNSNLSTPHVDALARDGARFDRFYVCPVCSPTRAEFLTGRYHPRCGVYSTSAGGERMDLDEMTIADTFRAAGYATAAFGKWHNGMQFPYHPNGRGFDEFYGFCSGHWGDYFSPPLDHNGQIVRGNGFTIDDFTDKALNFIETNQDRPFFAYLPYNTPHSPMQVPDRWWDKFKDASLEMRHRDPDREDVPHTRAALAMCENIDWNVGRILQKLDELKLARDTIVVYFCDNGPNGFRWNGAMKGRKGSTDEGGVRSPLLIRWPGAIAAGKEIPHIAAAIDLLPTLADLANIDVASKKRLDGVSVAPLLVEHIKFRSADGNASGLDSAPRDRMIFSHWGGRVSVRTPRHRLDHQGKLYDMVDDPGQYKDIADREPDIAARLRAAVDKWKKEVLSELGRDDRPFLIGHADYKYTQIPARDGTPHGNIKRSNRFPNCSYFTNWTNTDDRITWNAEVAAGGTYEVEIYYACPAADVGSTIELSFNDSRLRGQITEAHDPPLRGGEHDRVPRKESYVKDFQPLKLGTINLTQGQGELTLTAVAMPGKQVMEFRTMMFTRVAD
jgi:arylsulfatase A-like enzyme